MYSDYMPVSMSVLLCYTSVKVRAQIESKFLLSVLQVAAVIGIGLVYQGTGHRHNAEVLLSEIGAFVLHFFSNIYIFSLLSSCLSYKY